MAHEQDEANRDASPPPKRRKSTNDKQLDAVLQCMAKLESIKVKMGEIRDTSRELLKGEVSMRSARRSHNRVSNLCTSVDEAITSCREHVKTISKFPYLERVFQVQKDRSLPILAAPSPKLLQTPHRKLLRRPDHSSGVKATTFLCQDFLPSRPRSQAMSTRVRSS